MIRRPPRSTLFPYTRSSDLKSASRLSSYGSKPTVTDRKSTSCGKTYPSMARQKERHSRPRPQHPKTVTLGARSEEHTSELQSRLHLVCRLLLEKKKMNSTAA